MSGSEHELTTAHSKEENAIVERANQEVLRHYLQRIMNIVEKTAHGVTPAELVLNNSIRLSMWIFAELYTVDRSKLKSMSGSLDTWLSRPAILVQVAQESISHVNIRCKLSYQFICVIYTLSWKGE